MEPSESVNLTISFWACGTPSKSYLSYRIVCFRKSKRRCRV